ncbi:Uncharacterised protein [Mycobacteroides abscessus subsp. abscessus]|nr:Uncharacterised protein [Mycobacteroides abscessus subsp. abscessus]
MPRAFLCISSWASRNSSLISLLTCAVASSTSSAVDRDCVVDLACSVG